MSNTSRHVISWITMCAVIVASIFVLTLAQSTLLEKIYVFLIILNTFFQVQLTENSLIKNMKLVSFLGLIGFSAYIVITSSKFGAIIAVGHFWHFFFCVGMESKRRNELYYKVILVAIAIWIPLVSFRLIFSVGSVGYFENNFYVHVIGLVLALFLALLGFLNAYLSQREMLLVLEKKSRTINWFSTLVNLVSHNLRSPLATILGNAQILEAKYSSVFKSHELERITHSVQTSNQIIDRLLKASFVTDQLSNHTLEESLANVYPELVIRGGLDELSYEQGVSIHLSLEVFLDNAFKFSPDQVELTMKGTRIEIRDYGKGLTQEQLESFGRLKGNTLGTLHGIGIPFALRILESIGYGVRAENCNPGLLIIIDQEIEFKDAQLAPISKAKEHRAIS